VPPGVAALGPGNLAAGSLEDEDVLDERALLERRVDDGLRRDRLAATLALAKRTDADTDTRSAGSEEKRAHASRRAELTRT